VVVASGLAHGIDRIAHESTLECGGATFAVIGSGIDVEYPTGNARLQRRIAREGLVLSEFMPGEPALRHHFPKRNRLLAALTSATVVVEAAGRSGSLITADHALDLGREILAVPGPIGRSTSEGTNRLIRDGARIVTAPEDVLEALDILPSARTGEVAALAARLPEPGRSVLSALGDGPRHVDDLSRSAGLEPAVALGILLELELAGLVLQLPGKRFGRAA
jgi:DNA processing protein